MQFFDELFADTNTNATNGDANVDFIDPISGNPVLDPVLILPFKTKKEPFVRALLEHGADVYFEHISDNGTLTSLLESRPSVMKR
eukprot:scaffold3410_cov158-Amphora_coffeaeformis.AAC.5